MSRSLYLINPSTDGSAYYGADFFAAANMTPGCGVADLSTATVAALAPSDFDVRITDQHVSEVDLDTTADYVGLTGKSTQATRMMTLGKEFRARGKTVIMGGPFASLSPHVLRPYCDILVQGEIEDIAGDLFADLRSGRWKEHYFGGRPDIARSPVPRWDLYPNDRAMEGALQTSRGCPFECEFCDVIAYLGRKQRFKGVGQVLTELDELHRWGYRRVFLSDDNFTVAKNRAKEVLSALRDWNGRHTTSGPITFHTQASIEAAEDPELIRLCADAGLTGMFIGIETPNEASLRETKKYQNLRRSLNDSVETFVRNGITVRSGMIVGFDSDGPDIFQRMYDFAMSLPIPILNLASLSASNATPLYRRLKLEGRVRGEDHELQCSPLETNIVPKQMSHEELMCGMRWLAYELYRPEAFLHRLRMFVDLFNSERLTRRAKAASAPSQAIRPIYRDTLTLIKNIHRFGPEEARMCKEIFGPLRRDPATNAAVMEILWGYLQVRHAYAPGGGSWSEAPAPRFARAAASA